MLTGILWMASAMLSAKAKLEIATDNLANASSDGFHKHRRALHRHLRLHRPRLCHDASAGVSLRISTSAGTCAKASCARSSADQCLRAWRRRRSRQPCDSRNSRATTRALLSAGLGSERSKFVAQAYSRTTIAGTARVTEAGAESLVIGWIGLSTCSRFDAKSTRTVRGPVAKSR
jgi:hypothetical protein